MAQPLRLDLELFSRTANLHPDYVRRLVMLGLLHPVTDTKGRLWFAPDQLAAAARVERLRAGFAINYAAMGLVLELLDRIHELEIAQPDRPTIRGGRRWTLDG